MKAPMVNSTSADIIVTKMRDEMYLKHLREVEKINNREPEKISRDIKNYRSINQLHKRRKIQAFDWQHKLAQEELLHNNEKLTRKMREIRPYLHFKHKQLQKEGDQEEGERVETAKKEEGEPQRGSSSPSPQKEVKRYSLHYQYRKRRQEEIDHENSKLTKGILSQRSVYLPKIKMTSKLNSHSINVRKNSPDPSLHQ